MSSDDDVVQEMEAGLAHVARLQLALADKLHQMAQASDDAAEVADLAKALERTTRSLRLTYALRLRLRRDARRDAREEAAAQASRQQDRVSRRKQQLHAGVYGLLWREAERLDEEEDEELEGHVFELVEGEALSDTFLTEPLADQVARVVRAAGYEITPDGDVRALAPPPRPGEARGFHSSA
jgi:hypothetical protein